MEKIKLSNSDIDSLFDGIERVHHIGGARIKIRPLPLAAWPSVISGIMKIRSEVSEVLREGNDATKIPKLAQLLVSRAPAIIADLVGLEYGDLNRLPGGKVLAMAVDALEVNLESSGDLVKNLLALAARSGEITEMWKTLNPAKAGQ